tara:strand:- start:29 stop:904 length:876 start_codon:yes stop_codon:yes gene_type:complete
VAAKEAYRAAPHSARQDVREAGRAASAVRDARDARTNPFRRSSAPPIDSKAMNSTMEQALDTDSDRQPKVFPISTNPEEVKMSFNSKEEWEAELARRRAVRAADPWQDPDYCPNPQAAGVPLGGVIGKPQKFESDTERLRRTARERQYEKEIEKHKKESASLLEGVAPKDAEAWPPLPYYIEGGIVQNAKWDDDLDEVKYAWEHVTAWRDYVVKAKKCKHDLRCGNCYRVTPKAPLKAMARCSKCKVMRYCSKECQAKDWRVRHKTYCAGQAHLLEAKVCEFCRKVDCICG